MKLRKSATENIKYISGAEKFFENIMWTTKMEVTVSKSAKTKRIKIEFKMITMIVMMMMMMAAIVG
jgi:hypothetical protein